MGSPNSQMAQRSLNLPATLPPLPLPDQDSVAPVVVANITEAAGLISSAFVNTPQYVSQPISAAVGFELVLKVETINPLHSFKGRGADYYVRKLVEKAAGAPIGPLVAASVGNFGQGLAYACTSNGVKAIIFACETANKAKVAAMEAFGAEVKLAGRDYDEALQIGQAWAAAQDPPLPFVIDGVIPAITEGAGTIGLELGSFPEPIDAVLVPVGGGAMISGIASWYKEHCPTTKVIGVQVEGARAMELSHKAKQIVATEVVDTIADGVGVRSPLPEALVWMQSTVDDMVVVTDDEVIAAMKMLFQHEGLVAEGAGAVGLAAAVLMKEEFAGKRVAVIICGGNLTQEQKVQYLF